MAFNFYFRRRISKNIRPPPHAREFVRPVWTPMEPLESRILLSGEIFVTNLSAGVIGEYTTLGAAVNASLVSGLQHVPTAIAVSGSDIFVANYTNNSIGEYTTSGAPVNASLISLPAPDGIAVAGSDLFILSDDNNAIGEYTTSGATINASLVTGLNHPNGIAVSGSDLFVANFNGDSIGEYTTSGTTVNASLITGLNNPTGIAVSGSNLFVTNHQSGTVGEYTTSGATVNTTLISGLSQPYGIAISGTNLFVTNNNGSTIGEYTTSGATVNSSLISGLTQPYGIAITIDVAPTNVQASNGTFPHHIQLTWDAVDGAASYQVFRSTTNDVNTAAKIGVGITTTGFNDTLAVAGRLYHYWVRERNPAAIGPFGTSVSGFIPLPGPANLTASQGTFPRHVALTWGAVANASGYQVFRSTTNDVNTAAKIAGGITSTFFNDNTVAPGTTYFYWVRARNTVGVGLFSAAVSGFIN
jgi:hypothetical protein